MEAIVSLDCIKEIVKRVSGNTISKEKAGELLFQMEEELKAILWGSTTHENRQESQAGYTDLLKLIEEDPVYPPAVNKYLKGKLPNEAINSVPELIVDLLLELINKVNTSQTSRKGRG